MLTTSLRWLGNLATTDPFERHSAMTVQAFCIGLTLLTASDTMVDQVRGAGLAHSLPEITTALFSMLAVLLIRRGRIRAG